MNSEPKWDKVWDDKRKVWKSIHPQTPRRRVNDWNEQPQPMTNQGLIKWTFVTILAFGLLFALAIVVGLAVMS